MLRSAHLRILHLDAVLEGLRIMRALLRPTYGCQRSSRLCDKLGNSEGYLRDNKSAAAALPTCSQLLLNASEELVGNLEQRCLQHSATQRTALLYASSLAR